MIKRPHLLRSNVKGELPNYIFFFDTETFEIKIDNKETELKLKLGWICFWNRKTDNYNWLYFEKHKDFWNFIFKELPYKQRAVLIAHNISFDFRIMKGFQFLKSWSQDKIIFKGVTNIFKFSKNRKTLLFLDNMNFFNVSLETLGHSVGLEKLDIIKDDLKNYCKRDVEILIKAWKLYIDFLTENDLGNFGITLPSQALNAYRHRFMKNKIYIHNNENAIKAERESYHGGRVECFKIGKQPKQKYFLVDVISMYPSVMKFFDYPRKLIRIFNKRSVTFLNNLLYKNCVIANVNIQVKEPVFPFKKENKIIYPLGKFNVWLTTRELLYALEKNYIKRVNKIYVYEKANLFQSYVDFFYSKKKLYKEENNQSFSYMCKIFLNSLYGKFGQKIELFKPVKGTSETDGYFDVCDLDTGLWKVNRSINGKLQEKIGEQEGYESFVAIASHITADARMKLWNLIETAGRENVYYCDTDSLIVNALGYLKLKKEIGSDLGQLELKEWSENLKLNTLKDYEFGEHKIIKGIRKNAEQISQNVFKQIKFEGLSGAIRKNRVNQVVISQVEKTLKRNYDKGFIKGLNIEPFKLTGGQSF